MSTGEIVNENDVIKKLRTTYYALSFLGVCISLITSILIYLPTQSTDATMNDAAKIFLCVFSVFIFMLNISMSFCLFLSGTYLRDHKNRKFILVIAYILCLSIPFGTMIGIYTIFTLNKSKIKKLFE